MHTSIPVPAASFKLPIALDLAAAEDLLTVMRGLQTQPRACIDASAVETLTLPCVQILLATRQSCPHISVENPSAAFASAVEDFGLNCAALCNGATGTEPETERAAASPPPEAEPENPAASPMPEVQMEAPAADTTPAPLQAENAPMTRRILTIDDSKTIRDMLKLTLVDAGFDVLQAVDGQDGLDVLGKEQVDVVITDINMPRMDGYEVIRQMRSNTAYRATPILVLTTESEVDKKNIGRMAGATGWMVKPFDPARLIATINKVAP
jgi:two-component system, chemotaxis family, chemotaxis protein CheY